MSFERMQIDRLDAILSELRAIHALLEPAPEPQQPMETPEQMIAKVQTAAGLRRLTRQV